MSVKVMDRVWEMSQAKGAARLVLLALADWADDEGYCYPSVTAIVRKTQLTKPGVLQILRRLKALGEIEVTVRGHDQRDTVKRSRGIGGFQATNYYKVNVGNAVYRPKNRTVGNPVDQQVVNPVDVVNGVDVVNAIARGGKRERSEVVNADDPEALVSLNDPSVDPSIDPSEERTREASASLFALNGTDASASTVLKARFDRVAAVYPRADKLKRAFKAFQKLNPTDALVDAIILPDIELKKRTVWGGCEVRFITSLARYLEEERWTDELSAVAPYSSGELAEARRIMQSKFIGKCPHGGCPSVDDCLKKIAEAERTRRQRRAS